MGLPTPSSSPSVIASRSSAAVVALRKLIDAPDTATAIELVEEIIARLIGAKEFLVLLTIEPHGASVVGGSGDCLSLGWDDSSMDRFAKDATKMVPLFIGHTYVGAILFYDEKFALGALRPDREEILQLLSCYAASALVAPNPFASPRASHVS